MSLRTRRVTTSMGGGLRVTRTTFLDPRLNMFTLTLTTLADRLAVRIQRGQEFALAHVGGGDAVRGHVAAGGANYRAGHAAIGGHVHIDRYGEIFLEARPVVGDFQLSVRQHEHRLDGAHLRECGAGCQAQYITEQSNGATSCDVLHGFEIRREVHASQLAGPECVHFLLGRPPDCDAAIRSSDICAKNAGSRIDSVSLQAAQVC